MNIDFSRFFKEYEAVVDSVEDAFHRVGEEYNDCVKCSPGCSDCCYALFDLSFIEALYINKKANEAFSGKEKSDLLEKAGRADRKIYKLKKQAYKDLNKGKNEVDILGMMGLERVRCPLLNKEDQCDLYEFRPITCRLYGIPIEIDGMAHTCGKSGFQKGGKYKTVKLEHIHNRLYQISHELVKEMNTRYTKMGDLLVPLSMALSTDYNDEYLGILKD